MLRASGEGVGDKAREEGEKKAEKKEVIEGKGQRGGRKKHQMKEINEGSEKAIKEDVHKR